MVYIYIYIGNVRLLREGREQHMVFTGAEGRKRRAYAHVMGRH